jgi:hypothetical protein
LDEKGISMSRYRVVFTGLTRTEEYFKGHIARFGITPGDTDYMIKKAPVVLKEADSLEFIRKYAKAIMQAGGDVYIQTCKEKRMDEKFSRYVKGMSSFTQCPRCGHRQQKKVECERCGFMLKQHE